MPTQPCACTPHAPHARVRPHANACATRPCDAPMNPRSHKPTGSPVRTLAQQPRACAHMRPRTSASAHGRMRQDATRPPAHVPHPQPCACTQMHPRTLASTHGRMSHAPTRQPAHRPTRSRVTHSPARAPACASVHARARARVLARTHMRADEGGRTPRGRGKRGKPLTHLRGHGERRGRKSFLIAGVHRPAEQAQLRAWADATGMTEDQPTQ